MSKLSRITPRIIIALLATTLAAGGALAQDDERAERDAQKTKQAQAVSKEVYDKIQKAQEQVDAQDYQGALRALNSLYNPGEPGHFGPEELTFLRDDLAGDLMGTNPRGSVGRASATAQVSCTTSSARASSRSSARASACTTPRCAVLSTWRGRCPFAPSPSP